MSAKPLDSFAGSRNEGESYSKAAERAKKELAQRGIHYPVWSPGMPIIEFHDATLTYGQQEADLIAQYIKATVSPRPLEIDSVPKIPKWGRPYHDD